MESKTDKSFKRERRKRRKEEKELDEDTCTAVVLKSRDSLLRGKMCS